MTAASTQDKDGVMGKSGAFLGHALKLAGACAPLALAALPAGNALAQQADAKPYSALLDTYCAKCHNSEDWAGGVALDTLDVGHVGEEPKVWENTVRKLRGRLMPPAGQKQPSQADIDSFVRYLETSIDSSEKERIGHVPIQRLNRIEFAASVKNLIGVDIDPKQALPTEIEVEGFSNIAGALAVSPSFMDQYLSAARRAARLAVGEPVPKMAKVTIPATQAGAAAFPLCTRGGSNRGGIRFAHVFPADGEY